MSNSSNLRKFVAPEIIFGTGARKLVGKYAEQFLALKVLIVKDPGIINAGWLSDVTASLEEFTIPAHIYSNEIPHLSFYKAIMSLKHISQLKFI